MRVMIIRLLILTMVFLCAFTTTASAATVSGLKTSYSPNDNISVDYEADIAKGVLNICVTGSDNDFSLGIFKNDERYSYRLKPGEKAAIPFNMGNGAYNVKLFLYVGETTAVQLWETTFFIGLESENAPYLNPSKMVKWTGDSALAEAAKNLAVKDDPEKTALEICKFISKRYSFDKSITSVPAWYVPDLAAVYENSTGICYDYAALYTAMCRSVGIPTKMVFGYSPYVGMSQYHAWCLVLIDGKWRPIDPIYSMTHGAKFLDMGKSVQVRQY